MKIFKGVRDEHGCTVTVNGAPLDVRSDLRQHSAGFEWGYEGSGPRQLALAILAEHFGDDGRAVDRHQAFMETVVAELDEDQWTLTGDQIDDRLSYVVDVPMDLETLLNKVRGKT